MSRISPLRTLMVVLATTLAAPTPAPSLAQETRPSEYPRNGRDTPLTSGAPRWLEEVRAQRRALQQQRRAQHEARRRAVDPLGAAQKKAREEAFMRRRNEMRDMLGSDRRVLMNQSPWTPESLRAPRLDSSAAPSPGDIGDGAPARVYAPPKWDNGWYFRGW
ncbi:MAG: hypothetical protein WBG92_07590 [Thiohalocapsa sp.]